LSLGKRRQQNAKQSAKVSAKPRPHIVNFDGRHDLVGKLVDVKITRATGLSLTGELV